ncbi:MAG: YidC/Oxa1 family membrane protein insertase [Acidimicrobiales bacterium]
MLASIIGQIGHPFYLACAWLLAAFFALVPNYAIAIALLTLAVMIVTFPLTLRGTRGIMKMQLLAPEIKKLQARYKVLPGMGVAERQELRQRQQQEMSALYRENDVSPAGGCLPMLLQFPVFIVLYGTIRGLVHRGVVKGTLAPDPLYISHGSKIYLAVQSAHGHLVSFGLNLADSLRTPGLGWDARLPFIAMILVAIALQYVQMRQMNGRRPTAAAATPQTQQLQQLQRVFPLVLAVIYVSIPAGVNLYFIVSSLFRIAQQEVMYRRDPHIRASVEMLRAEAAPG